MNKKAVFFDRDGVINKSISRGGKPYPPENLNEFEFIDGIKEVVDFFKHNQYVLIIITNQPDVARGKQSIQQVETFHRHILKTLSIDKIYTCFHDDKDHCECRKPKPGMLYQAQKDFGLNLKICFGIGDRWRDIGAFNAAGCQSIFIDYGYQEPLTSHPHYRVNNLKQVLSIFNKYLSTTSLP